MNTNAFPFLPGTVIYRHQVEQALGISRASAHRWVVRQVKAGRLFRHGTTRDARYEVLGLAEAQRAPAQGGATPTAAALPVVPAAFSVTPKRLYAI